jgi:hypothetical protein
MLDGLAVYLNIPHAEIRQIVSSARPLHDVRRTPATFDLIIGRRPLYAANVTTTESPRVHRSELCNPEREDTLLVRGRRWANTLRCLRGGRG